MISLIIVGKKSLCLFANYEVIKPLQRYDCIVDGVVITDSGDNLLSPLEIVKCERTCQWVLSQYLYFHHQTCMYISKSNWTNSTIFVVCLLLGFEVHDVDSQVKRL